MIHVLIIYKSRESVCQFHNAPFLRSRDQALRSFHCLPLTRSLNLMGDGRSRSQNSGSAVSARSYGPGTKKSKKLDALLRVIERDWSFMRDENCVPDLPVQVALQLMDTSSLGLGDWRSSTRTLRRGMKDLQLAKTGFAGYC
ncbi:hypothetical protein FPQ18DRAFT_392643 [Pyronema domesticum]|nr:hypothetical protein FPQ18DRAFT_392643 [Pyronema domesticum]